MSAYVLSAIPAFESKTTGEKDNGKVPAIEPLTFGNGCKLKKVQLQVVRPIHSTGSMAILQRLELLGILVMVWRINGNQFIMIRQVIIGLECKHGVKNEMP